ncbi:uncharacterized protein Tco025E_10317 [Trypanosoma conorhini]|uniref:Uncharacterized protein n=1 Tax=Trypanosoma conorhini TaxID=83891 RepID=A0A422MNL0_9TRYP|nr:uncharacterized protein Tco025E_10317 [Trypanosoma conorhini]RNE94806.1 hypothetical protein Tco025E_10317 [Trypanosoma conorhini]
MKIINDISAHPTRFVCVAPSTGLTVLQPEGEAYDGAGHTDKKRGWSKESFETHAHSLSMQGRAEIERKRSGNIFKRKATEGQAELRAHRIVAVCRRRQTVACIRIHLLRRIWSVGKGRLFLPLRTRLHTAPLLKHHATEPAVLQVHINT